MRASLITATAALLVNQASAGPVTRRGQGWEMAAEIIKLFGTIFGTAKGGWPTDVNAWEYYTNENLCEVYMETRDGANCYVSVQCNDDYNSDKATWNVCYLGGRQYFNDPRIGDFSVTFTEKDGVDGQGLTGPVLQVKEIGNWQEIHAKDLALQKENDEDCKKHNGLKCGKGPYVCSWLDYNQDNGRTRKWKCGVPKRGQNFPGLDSNMPVNDRGFAPGWCTVHITQWQTPNALEAKVYDANQAEIGNSGGKQGDKLKFGSKLPLWFLVDGSAGSDQPIKFEYDAQFWDTNDKDKHHCTVGTYDGGKREIDCGYTCK